MSPRWGLCAHGMGLHTAAHRTGDAAMSSGEQLLDRLADNVWARFARTVLLPIVTLLTLPLIASQWNALKADVSAIKATQEAQAAKYVQLEQRVAVIDTKLDAGLIWRLTQLEQRFDGLQSRMDARAGASADSAHP